MPLLLSPEALTDTLSSVCASADPELNDGITDALLVTSEGK